MKLRNVVLGVLMLCAQFAMASDAAAQIHEGDWYCYDCTFGGPGSTATPETRGFIGQAVNPHVDTWMELNMTPHAVTICNGTTCALYTYTGGGVFLQVGPSYPDTHDQEDYENSEDAPPDTSSGGGGGGGGVDYYWLGGALYGGGTCIYGCATGKVEVGDVDPQ